MTDTSPMHFRRERVRIETDRHDIEGTLQLPNEGYRSRTTDFLNAHERDFLAVTDAELTWLDGSREPERQEYLAIAVRHIVLVLELETLGVFDESGAEPTPTEREGFEPSDEVDPRHTISNRARSAAPAPLLETARRVTRLRSARRRGAARGRARRRP